MKTTEQPKYKESISPRLSGVGYDEKGLPIGHTVEEVFDRLDKELIDSFGENVREMVNESRSEWNKKYPWKFEPL